MVVSLLIWDTPLIRAIEKCIGEDIIRCHTRDAALSALPKADIVIIMGGGGLLLDDEMLDVSERLKLVLSISAGIEKLPLTSLHERNIAVCNTKGAQAVSIAEYVLGEMIAFNRSFTMFQRNQAKAHWQYYFAGRDLDGQTVCIIGAGNIGSQIGKKVQAFDMQVLGLKRHPESMDYFNEVWGIDRLQEALGQADFVVLVTPLTPDTYHLMGQAEFNSMKRSAVFINVSRGDTVDEAALLEALNDEKIAGAILDVFRTEPLPSDSPFWAMENVIVTPHSAGPTLNAEQKMIDITCENIKRQRSRRPLINQVKKGNLY